MAFDVTFYQFTKAERSTERPSASLPSATYSCVAKSAISVTRPEVSLRLADGASSPVRYNYAYIPVLGRYYYVSGWTAEGPLWYARLVVDELATYRDEIGAHSLYVYRSSAAFDRRIVDTVYPTTGAYVDHDFEVPSPLSGSYQNGHTYVCATIIGKAGPKAYIMEPSKLRLLMAAIFSDDFYSAILGEFGATEYPEAKVAINPLQYITSVKLFQSTPAGTGYWGFPTSQATYQTSIDVAGITVQPTTSAELFSCYAMPESAGAAINVWSTQTAAYRHPQAAARGEWLDNAPYTEILLFYPPFGLIQIDPEAFLGHTVFSLGLAVNWAACGATLTLAAGDAALNAYTLQCDQVLSRLDVSFGAPYPLSNITTPGVSAMSFVPVVQEAISAVTSFAAGGLSGIAGGVSHLLGAADSGISTAVHGRIPHLSSSGTSYGGAENLRAIPKLYIRHWLLSDDDNAHKGRPLCKVRQLSSIPGFIMADPSAISLPATSEELAAVRAAVEAGFYYV